MTRKEIKNRIAEIEKGIEFEKGVSHAYHQLQVDPEQCKAQLRLIREKEVIAATLKEVLV